MEREEFVTLRKILKKTQVQMAQLLGISLKAIHSYEQGWRDIPAHAERQLLFLAAMVHGKRGRKTACWVLKDCPENKKKSCPAWEFKAGSMCWFINGNICEGIVHKKWQDKIQICRSCVVFQSVLGF